MKKIFSFLKRLFRNLKTLAQKFVTPSVLVVEALKNAVESPVTPIITALIPGNVDNKIVEGLKKHLPRVLQLLRISEECLKLEAADEILKCAIKKAVESPVMPIVTAIIPGNLDNKIVDGLKKHLPRVLQILRISDECLKLEAADEIIFCAIKKLKEYEPEARAAQYHSIAAMLSVYLSDKKLSWREAVHLSEEIFQQTKQPL